jgi:hypothetical protein
MKISKFGFLLKKKIIRKSKLPLRYKCKKLSFIARTGLKYERGTREYFKGCECNNGTFYTCLTTFYLRS